MQGFLLWNSRIKCDNRLLADGIDASLAFLRALLYVLSNLQGIEKSPSLQQRWARMFHQKSECMLLVSEEWTAHFGSCHQKVLPVYRTLRVSAEPWESLQLGKAWLGQRVLFKQQVMSKLMSDVLLSSFLRASLLWRMHNWWLNQRWEKLNLDFL